MLCERKADADKHYVNVRSDVARGQCIDPRSGKLPLRAYGASWLAGQTFDPSTREAVELRLRVHVYPVLGDHELRSLAQRPSLVQVWVRDLQGQLADNYVRTVFANLSAVLTVAVDDGLIVGNPCRVGSVKPPAPDRRKVQPWSAERVQAVRAGLIGTPRRWTPGPVSACGRAKCSAYHRMTSTRLRRIVHVRRQVKYVESRLVLAPPKGGKERDAPLSDTVSLRLAAHIQRPPVQAITLPWRVPDGKPATAVLMYTGRERAAINRKYFNARICGSRPLSRPG